MSPDNNAGKKVFEDKNCMERCNIDSDCTGFTFPVSDSDWCETYTSIGATGDGRSAYTCYMKQSNVITKVCLTN